MTRDELVRSLCTPLPDVVRQRKESGDLAGSIGAAERHRFYFGNLDPARIVANRVFEAELTPAGTALRVDPYDHQTGELEREGAEVPFTDADLHTEYTLLRAETPA